MAIFKYLSIELIVQITGFSESEKIKELTASEYVQRFLARRKQTTTWLAMLSGPNVKSCEMAGILPPIRL
ncbi:hypothetical protein RRG08_027254 [Elysia crispata]|uniref:Uncharacterized protein n=1 Tax=Elysia crispata TaxID=231223 RepID=A0AAE1DMN1_9GAST|nr:hypothetical protein RRG08_027254 [Elysia crispata]